MHKFILVQLVLLLPCLAGAQNVGVGTTNPTEKLEVTGNLKFTGDNLVTGTINRIAPLYIRGTGLNNNANRVLRVGSTELYNLGTGRGLTLTILNKSNHAVVSTTNYDTYGDPNASNSLATALNALSNTQMGVITSFDAWEGQITQNLKDAFKRLGLYKAFNTTVGGSRRPYAAIFEGASSGSIPSGSAVEVEHSDNLNQPYAEIRGWLVDGSYVATMQVPSGLATPVGNYAVGVNEGGTVQVSNLAGSGTRIVTVDANGNLIAGSGVGTGVITGSGTLNYVPKWTPDGATLGNSQIFDNGAGIGIATTTINNRVQLVSDGSTQALQLNTSSYIGLNQWGTRMFKQDIGGGIPLKFENQFTDTWHGGIDLDHGQSYDHPSLKAYNAIMPSPGNANTAGLFWPINIGGGGGDEAFIRYYVESGENTKLMIGINNDADDDISFYQGSAERMNIYNGNVGIGITAPAQRLHVAGHTQVTENLYVSTNNTTGGGIFLADDGSIVDNNDGYASMRFSLGVTVNAGLNNNTQRIILRNDGNIQMVNNTSPTLNFNDSDEPDYYLHANSDRLYFLRGDGYNAWDGNRPLTIYQGDKVGINNITPSGRLHVDGDNLTSAFLQQNGDHSYGLTLGLQTGDSGSDGPRIGFNKMGAKKWAMGIEPVSDYGFAIWENGYNDGWGTTRFFIRPGTERPSFFKDRSDGDWNYADLVLERTGTLGYYPSLAFHNPGLTAPQWFGSYSPERINAGNCCDDFGWIPVGASGFQTLSDLSVKKNVVDLSEQDFFTSLQQIRNIQSIRYNYLNEIPSDPEPYSGQIKRDKPHLGFSAQSLPDIIVEEMTKSPATGAHGTVKGYDLGGMDGLLVAGVKALDYTQQQQDEKIKMLESKIQAQEQTIAELMKSLEEQRTLIETLMGR